MQKQYIVVYTLDSKWSVTDDFHTITVTARSAGDAFIEARDIVREQQDRPRMRVYLKHVREVEEAGA